MNWPDLMLERDPGTDVLRASFADIFGVPISAVAVMDGLGLLDPDAPEPSGLVVQAQPLRGAAGLLVRAFPPVSPAEAASDEMANALDAARRLATTLDLGVLVEDEGLDPSAYLRLNPDGTAESIVLDDDLLVRDGVVHILASEPAQRGRRLMA